MAPQNRQYYGKKSAAQNKLAARCFAASSSPIHPQNKPEVLETASTHHESNSRSSYISNESEYSKEDSDIENLADGFGSLKVAADQQRYTKEAFCNSKSQINVLHDVETNSPRRESPRLKDQRLRGLNRPSPETLSILNQSSSSVQLPDQDAHASDRTNLGQKTQIQLEKDIQVLRARKQRKKQDLSPTKVRENDSHIRNLLSLCSADSENRKAPIDFQEWSDSVAAYFDLTKLAEASYGEVFRLSLKETNSSFTTADESVIKLIALKPGSERLSELTRAQSERVVLMSAPEDVANEVRLLKHMTCIPGFTNFRDLKIVRGRLASQFCTAWRHFDRNVKKSDFINPSSKNSYNEHQLWAVVEMQDAGRDLENVIAENVWMCWDAFWGVACALAKGEEWANFEHRDLHLGNVCVRWNDPDNVTPEPRTVREGAKLGFTGLETTLIDYTLSRADMFGSQYEAAPDIAYFDLSKDQTIFLGDSTEDYQYDIYRHMRSTVITGDPCAMSSPSRSTKPACSGSSSTVSKIPHESAMWSQFHPLTNLVWLHFVLFKLTESVKWPSSTRGRKAIVGSDLTKRKKALDLECKILHLQKMLELEQLKDALFSSAGELIGWAINEGWLDLEDVVGSKSERQDHVKMTSSRKVVKRVRRVKGTKTK